MQDQLSQQENKPKWSAEIKENSLLIEYQSNVAYQGWLNQSPYFNLNVIKQIVQKGEVQILSKTSTKMKIRIMTVINLELHNQDYLQIQNLKKRVKQLQEQVKLQWKEEDLNSTQPFDINCLYRVKLNNSYTCICSYVDVNTLYHFHTGNSAYNIQRTNRKASSTGHAVTQIWKQKVL